eukprot:COSAG05_NODE_3969_length_1744_cov_10.313070_2_plen_120_part_00
MYYTNVYIAPVFDSSMGACSWQTSKAAECRAEIEALEGDFHLVGRLAGWANGVGGVCIGVTGLTVVVGLVRLATVYLALAHVAIVFFFLSDEDILRNNIPPRNVPRDQGIVPAYQLSAM